MLTGLLRRASLLRSTWQTIGSCSPRARDASRHGTCRNHTWWCTKHCRSRRALCELRTPERPARLYKTLEIIGQHSGACGSTASRAGCVKILRLNGRLLSARTRIEKRVRGHKAGLLMHCLQWSSQKRGRKKKRGFTCKSFTLVQPGKGHVGHGP